MSWFRKWKIKARELEKEVLALSSALSDSRVPWYARFLAVIIVAYALSPIDLIPDFIPILGYLDDLILVPVGMYLVIRLIPAEVMQEHRKHVSFRNKHSKAKLIATIAIILIWLAIGYWLYQIFKG